MRKPSEHRNLRVIRNLGPQDLTERVTLRHFTYTQETRGRRKSLGWEGEVWASWDDRIGGLQDVGGTELVSIDATAGIRNIDSGSVVHSELRTGDELVREGIEYTIEYLERGAYGDGYLAYLTAKGM